MLKPTRLLTPAPERRKRKIPWRQLLLFLLLVAFLVTVFFFLFFLRHKPVAPAPAENPVNITTKSVVVQTREIMPWVLNRAGIPATVADRIIKTLRDFGFNFRLMRPGDSLILCYRADTLFRLHYWRNYDSIYQIDLDSTDYRVTLLKADITIIPVVINGAINTSLYQALLDRGETPALVASYTEVFDWEIDFFSETQSGDSFFILVARKYLDSTPVGYGPVIAARYKGLIGDFSAFRFTDPEGRTDYYDPEGQSMRKVFLKSPLRFSRISSFFGRRFHPIRRVVAQHQGIDYVAPKGTPVSCVADGRVIFAGWCGGYGRLVRVGHSQGYETRYGHLSAFGRGIKTGAPVTQGQIIGYVGSTGLSTGPHLHYEVSKFGTPVNPLRLNPPRLSAVKLAYLPQFQALRDSLMPFLRHPPPAPVP